MAAPSTRQVFTDFKYPDIVNNIGSSRRGLGVEIDVVAQGGAWWVEVKSHERFGINSTHWAGRKGHVKVCCAVSRAAIIVTIPNQSPVLPCCPLCQSAITGISGELPSMSMMFHLINFSSVMRPRRSEDGWPDALPLYD